MYSVRDAATRLNVSERRVRALIESGRLRAQRICRSWIIEPAALGGWKANDVQAGRSPRNSLARITWGVTGPRKPTAAVLRSRYRGRAERHDLTCAQPAKALEDPQVATGGWQAAVHFDKLLDNDPTKPLVAYIGASNFQLWINRYWLTSSNNGRVIASSSPTRLDRGLSKPAVLFRRKSQRSTLLSWATPKPPSGNSPVAAMSDQLTSRNRKTVRFLAWLLRARRNTGNLRLGTRRRTTSRLSALIGSQQH